jgi:polyhydroxyalkanoate synthesis regulator phasin
MKTLLKVVGIATLVAVLGVVGIGAVAYAQDDGSGGPFDFGGRFREAVAEALGISVEDYDAAVEKAQEQLVDEALAEGWLTEDQAEKMRKRMEQGLDAWGGGKGFMGPRRGLMGHGEGPLFGLIADELGISVQDLFADLRDGKSYSDLLSKDQIAKITNDYLIQLEENLNQAVADGKITENQANAMLEQAKERVPEVLNGTWEGRFPGGFPGGKRPGGMRGFPGQTDA